MVEAAEAGGEALGLEGHQVLVEAAHEDPTQHLAMIEFVEKTPLL